MATAPSASFNRDTEAARLPIWREMLAGLDWLALHASPIFYGIGVPRFMKVNEKPSGTPASLSRRFASARDLLMSFQ